MAQPKHVPRQPAEEARYYESPPVRDPSWRADRPGEVVTVGQPEGDRFGNQGPDQGYVLKLARRFEGELTLSVHEEEADAVAGCVGVALKRASLFGRAPTIHDLTVAFTVWGFLSEHPRPELVGLRRHLFEEVSNPHHYAEARRVVDMVPAEVLRLPPAEVKARQAADWRSVLDLEA